MLFITPTIIFLAKIFLVIWLISLERLLSLPILFIFFTTEIFYSYRNIYRYVFFAVSIVLLTIFYNYLLSISLVLFLLAYFAKREKKLFLYISTFTLLAFFATDIAKNFTTTLLVCLQLIMIYFWQKKYRS